MRTSNQTYRFRIHSQLFLEQQGQFCIYDEENDILFQMGVKDVFSNKNMLFQFSPEDISALAFTAGVENVLQERKIIDAIRESIAEGLLH